MSDILLVEPSYRNKYPPLALMKISTYHKKLGDNVYFCKGKVPELKNKIWDRIYISTLFTFYWRITLETIRYYKNSVEDISDIFCGGVLATVLKDELLKKFPVTIISGLINKPGILGNDSYIVDILPPDYSILDTENNEYLSYRYPMQDHYIAYATRGCIRKCEFCAVPILEPCYVPYVNIKEQVEYIRKNFGEKKNLLLLDNNVLASKDFDKIIEDIKDAGFSKGAYIEYEKNGRMIKASRYVDFNQGIDSRLLTKEKCERLAELAIKPLRIAFDYADEETISLYTEKARMAASCGIKYLSNYILFNFHDTPRDFYKRLLINIELNEEFQKKDFNTKIFSFPMKYSPVSGPNCFNRKHIGPNWNRKYLRAIQCILNATHGVVGPKRSFFYRAFGGNYEEFLVILSMPENYIINRSEYEEIGLKEDWETAFIELQKDSTTYHVIHNEDLKSLNADTIENDILYHYLKCDLI